MIKANRELLTVIEQATVKRIYRNWRAWRKRLDVFHVAFSGGKDSVVLLDLVRKALPRDAFCVVFGDTGMEFPDTYAVVERVRAQCRAEGIAFYTAKSRFAPQESWKLFGPPSQVLRWCCSVHKSAPQTLKLREILGRDDFAGMDYVGVRAHESLRRSEYEYDNFGKKQRGQHSHNPILEWTSAEIWLHIYANNLDINVTYKKGNARAGCLFCPMSSGKSDWMRRRCYKREVDGYVAIINESNGRDAGNKKALDSHIANGGWNSRKNGRFLADNESRYSETTHNGMVKIEIGRPKTDWREWMKTLGDLNECERGFELLVDGERISFALDMRDDGGCTISYADNILNRSPALSRQIRQVFRKAAFCVKCGTCQANCRHGCLSLDPDLSIRECVRCRACHEVSAGCLAYDSLKIPTGDGEHMNKSINSFSDHAPKTEWFNDFFERGAGFFAKNNLGPVQNTKFKRFLADAGLVIKKDVTPLCLKIMEHGWDGDVALGIMLANLAYNPQFAWYARQMAVGVEYSRKTVEGMLAADGVSEKDAKSIVKAFKRIVETPLGTSLRFGNVRGDGEKIEALSRTPCVITEPLVVLYALFKFSEACGDYRQFTLGRLMDFSVQSDGISPARIFGIERERLRGMLEKLAANHHDFISVSFALDLEKISLAEGRSSADVLGVLFREKVGKSSKHN
jgi:phosphoadenosine phosphosulfate reductase